MKTRTNLSLQPMNPDLPVEAIEGAVEEICRDRTTLSLAEANREIASCAVRTVGFCLRRNRIGSAIDLE